MHDAFEWLEFAKDILTDYNEGQKENSTNNNMVFLGIPRTGKNYAQFFLKEIGLRRGDIKLIEAHASEIAHLAEILELMFPNGFFENLQCIEELQGVKTQLKKDAYREPTHSADELQELIQQVRDSGPEECIRLLEDAVERESTYRLRRRLEEATKYQERILEQLLEIKEHMAQNGNMPDTLREAYDTGSGVNHSFSIEVFTPISTEMPSGPVPDFFTPFAIPVDAYKRHEDMDWGLRIIHGHKYRSYKQMYNRIIDAGDTSLADIKNVESIDDDKVTREIQYGDGKTIEVTKVDFESQSLDSFKRDWVGTFAADGVLCQADFEHRLRPKLKQALLSDEPEVLVLYTGFLRDKSLRKFVMTYFLETYRDIIQNLSGSDVKKLDRKFVVSLLEGQEAVMKSGDKKLDTEDIVFNSFIREAMNNGAHFNTDFWVDLKPDEAHPTLLSKSSIKVVTQMNTEDLGSFQWDSDMKKGLKKCFDDEELYCKLNEWGYGFVVLNSLTGGNIPEWTLNGRTTYGHRLPCPRMTASKPVDMISNDDFSFFTDRLGYSEEETIRFEEYQEALFGEDWQEAEQPHIEQRRQELEEEKKEQEKKDQDRADMRKQVARSKMREKVAEYNVPSHSTQYNSWTALCEEIKAEMIEEGVLDEDFSTKQIMDGYTKDLRDQLDEEAEQEQADSVDERQVADELKVDETFVFGATSKTEKQRLAERYLSKKYDLEGPAAEDLAEEAAALAAMDLKTENVIDSGHRPNVDKDEFRELMGVNVESDGSVSDQTEADSEPSENDAEPVEESDDPANGPSSEGEYTAVEITESVPEFWGVDEEQYGPFEPGEIVEVPADNAEILTNRDTAQRLESGESLVNGAEAEAEEHANQGDKMQEAWSCECGTWNEAGRTVCRNPNCTKKYSELSEG
jgi:hypothetical protein